jgi:hypothetical protein
MAAMDIGFELMEHSLRRKPTFSPLKCHLPVAHMEPVYGLEFTLPAKATLFWMR